MQKSNQRLNTFISEITSGKAPPIPNDEQDADERIWSGPSVMAFAKLTEVLAALKAEDLELVVVDVDGSPDLYELPEFNGKISGSGETAWVRHGKIVSTSGRGLNVERFQTNTLALHALP